MTSEQHDRSDDHADGFGRGRIVRIAEQLGCSEGRVYTILIGLNLSLSMAAFAIP